MMKTKPSIVDRTRAMQPPIAVPALATITAKLQLTLPKRLCAQVGLTRGDKVAVTIEHGAIVLTPLRTVIEAAAGSLSIERSTG